MNNAIKLFTKARRFGRILVYTLSMYLVTHLIVFFFLFPIGTPLIIFNPRNRYRIKKRITGSLFKIIGQRLNILGIENLEPGKNYLIVPNYPGSYAGFALMDVFPESTIFVHSFLSRVPIVGFLLKSSGATFVQWKRFGKTKQAVDETLRYVRNKNLIIFPEGGRSADGQIHKFKRGFIYILRHSSLDLLPVTLRGFYGLKPMKRVYLDPDSDLEVMIHKPIGHSVIESLNDEALLKLTVHTIEGAYRP
jgi:1-acyl-sn-glycerol-3-phosphate acyltransferase